MTEMGSNTEQGSASTAGRGGVFLPLLAAVGVMLAVATIPSAPFDLKVDADTSSSAVLNYARQQGLQFGTDLVYLYGPLGHLLYFYYAPETAGTRLVVAALFSFTVAAGICLVAWRLGLVGRCALLGLFMFLAANADPRTDLLMDTGLLCWGLLCFAESGRRLAVSAVVLVLLGAFGGLAKTLVLVIAGLSVVLVAGDLLARGYRRGSVGVVAGFGAVVALGWMATGQELGHLIPCLRNALAVVQGYSQSLGWEGLPQVALSGLLVMLMAMAMVVIRARTVFEGRDRRRVWRRGLLLVWTLSLLFVTWKHGLARGDAFHVAYFFGFVPVLALGLEALPAEGVVRRFWARALGVACCCLSVVTLQVLFFPPGLRSVQQPLRTLSYHARCLLKPGEYRRRMDEVMEDKRREAQLPRLRRIIGRGSVDVFGQHQIYALLNGLNYRPRPVFQSYVACNARLMRLNEAFYESSAAPEFVMFKLGPIDRRFPPLEDAMVLRHLLMNCEPAGAEGDFLLLKRKSSEPARLKLLREGVKRPGERIELGGLGGAELWLEVSLEPTWSGRLRQMFYQPPTVRLAAWREGGKGLLVRRRAPAAMLAAGFVASPLLLQHSEILAYYSGQPVPRPAAYSVELLPGEEHFWQNAIRFRVFEVVKAKDSSGLPQ